MPEYFDMHCHLLYGVDDGPRDIEQSLELLRLEYEDGVRTIFLTPHHRRDLFECPDDVVVQHYEALCDRARQRFPDLKLILGRELHVHTDLVQTLKTGQAMTMGLSDHVLLEFPEYADKRYLINSCHAVIQCGFRPIIAHAERCGAIRSDIALLQQLVELGVRIQINAGSILGEEGLAMKWFCRSVMKRNLLHYVGSDSHNTGSRRPNIGKCAAYMERIMGKPYRDRIMILNPQETAERSARKQHEPEY